MRGRLATPTGLHTKSGVGRATIYRNWPEPEDLIEIMLGLPPKNRRAMPVAPDFITGILAPVCHVVADALERGVLAGDEDDLVSELTGPMVLDHVILGRSVSKKRARVLIDQFSHNHT